jgi:hypothetical protein
VLVVCPALNSPLRHWVSDEDGARERFDVPVWHVIVDLEREAEAASR